MRKNVASLCIDLNPQNIEMNCLPSLTAIGNIFWTIVESDSFNHSLNTIETHVNSFPQKTVISNEFFLPSHRTSQSGTVLPQVFSTTLKVGCRNTKRSRSEVPTSSFHRSTSTTILECMRYTKATLTNSVWWLYTMDATTSNLVKNGRERSLRRLLSEEVLQVLVKASKNTVFRFNDRKLVVSRPRDPRRSTGLKHNAIDD